MPSFRKKPVVITAERLPKPMVVRTLEGDMQAGAGDWLIKGVKGELYPCKDDVFRHTYEPIDKDGVQALAVRFEDEPEIVSILFPGAEAK